MAGKSFLVVDIGNKNTKILSGGFKNDKYYIREYDILPTPINSIKDGKIIEINSILKMIKPYKDLYKDKDLLLTIGGTGLITREVQLPKSTDEELWKILQFEAQQYFPVDLQNYSFDYRVIEEYEVDNIKMYRVLLVAVPIRQVDEYMKIHEDLKIEIEAIDITANTVPKALFQLTNQNNVASPNEFAVIDIGSESSLVYIFLNKKLRFSRMILNGSSSIDMAISTQLEIDLKAAEETKKKHSRIIMDEVGFSYFENEKILSDLIKDGLESITGDVTRFFDFYNSREVFNKIDRIYICGGGSKINGLELFLSQCFQVPVEYIFPFDNIEYKGKKPNHKFDEDRVFLVSAIGCLVRENLKT